MTLFSFLGDVGTGKTLMATIMAIHDPRPIYANYEIKVDSYHELFPETLNTLREPSIVVLDEAYTWIESRCSGTPIHRYMSYILFQSRKRGMDIILTDQIDGVIDTRYRQMINYNILCELLPDIGFEYLVFKKSILGYHEPMPFIMPFEIAELFYQYYDTHEIISSIDEELMYKVSTHQDDTVEKVDAIADKIIVLSQGRKLTKGVVADFCLRNDYPRFMVNLVSDAIKARAVLSDKYNIQRIQKV